MNIWYTENTPNKKQTEKLIIDKYVNSMMTEILCENYCYIASLQNENKNKTQGVRLIRGYINIDTSECINR